MRSDRRHTYTASVQFGGDEPTWEGEVTYGFNLQPAERETPVCPASGTAVIDVVVLEIDGRPRPWAWSFHDDRELEEMLVDKADAFEDEMLASALEEAADEAADAAEYRAEMRAEMRGGAW